MFDGYGTISHRINTYHSLCNIYQFTLITFLLFFFCSSKYPKTDYTYSLLSKDRVELAPGQVAMPNMSRRSLSQFRVQGPNTSADEVDRLAATASWTTSNARNRYTVSIVCEASIVCSVSCVTLHSIRVSACVS